MPQTVWCRVSLLLKNDSVKWHIYFFTFLLCLLNAKTLFLHSSMLLTSSPYQLSVCRHQVNQHSLVCTRKTIKVDKNQDKDHKQHKIYGEGGGECLQAAALLHIVRQKVVMTECCSCLQSPSATTAVRLRHRHRPSWTVFYTRLWHSTFLYIFRVKLIIMIICEGYVTQNQNEFMDPFYFFSKLSHYSTF